VAWNPLQAVARNPTAYRMLMRRSGLVAWSERAIRKVSRGRIGVLDLVGIPSIVVTVPGRRTGIARSTTLQCSAAGDELLVVGSNWGSAHHPEWSQNLRAAAVVEVRRRSERFQAGVRELTGAERTRAWATIVEAWPNY
jgi:deazaflavin-dependent oxidoreductase (nitroreductase family)